MKMREIKWLVVHCSATRASADIGAGEIRAWHMGGRGWRDIGYHYVIRRDGRVEDGRPLDRPGAHVVGHNARSVGICLAGGLDERGRPEDNFTEAQRRALKVLLLRLRRSFPAADILGHRDFPAVRKDCPCFDVRGWLKTAGGFERRPGRADG